MSRIKIIDNLHPEDDAMLQALQSRSPARVEDRLKKVEQSGSGEFMDKFYVGYGHKSIADCGTTTIYIEGVTMLCAKAIQDWPLYAGQEASTRYMDFTDSEFYNPLGTAAGEEIQEAWRILYIETREQVVEDLKATYPRKSDEDAAVWGRAINARSFDICRSLLPAGAMTNLSWHTNLRQASDHLDWLRLHPDRHINDVAGAVHGALGGRYTHTFKDDIRHEDYRRRVFESNYYLAPYDSPAGPNGVTVDPGNLIVPTDVERLLAERPKGMEVPWFLAELGQIESGFALDFGSYRDLQRHRNGTIRMPLLTTELGFHPWYLESLSDDLREKVQRVLFDQEVRIAALDCPPVVLQNYIAMGYQVQCRVTQGLPGFIYRLELRSGKSVHPTLRKVVQEEIRQFGTQFPNVALYVDMDPDSWTVRRGEQTITEKA